MWTNREATTTADIPGRVLLVGGGAVGVELGQFYAGMGAQVTIVQRAATRGTLGLMADRTRRVLTGAWAVAPLASEWIHQAALAIRAQVSIEVLLDQIAQFPTYSEAYLAALEQLAF